MTVVTMVPLGDTVGISFPQETRDRMHLAAGQSFTVVELADGIKLVKHSARLERQLELAREVLHDHAEGLRELAHR